MAKRANADSSPVDAEMRVVVLTGKDSLLRLERSHALEAGLKEKFGSVDRFDFDGATVSLATVLDELRMFGLLAVHKLVVVDQAEAFMGAEERRRAMERYAEQPQGESTLLMRSASGWRPGNFDKIVAKVGAVIKCDSPGEEEALAWCLRRATQTHGADLEEGAAALLVEKIGCDLARLDAELGKLSAAAAKPGESGAAITRKLVQEFTGLSREEQAWEIQQPVLAGDAAGALRLLHELLTVSRVPEVMIGWSLVDLTRKLHDASRLLAAGRNEGDVARALKLWGPGASTLTRTARKLSPRVAARMFAAAINADQSTKNGTSLDPARTFEMFAAQVAGQIAR
ncbi:MAG: DNA polymerase III subunit delta [Planctomycetes bacterium]|nr:DNA polymerase III subunit delta [Planctomycetota bacterium]